ncbi:hypothetical protein MB84_31585 (plasmid) [Pandoraea oxalativorans]|uniref:Uncharacterized protein n=1 Tax=Pandoraea oxalativorans TaxID=573737 RepID=A0A192B1R5_9BURK|nr:hypothetical protein MB84_31585 [Pandoraea oxalativorans]
MRDVAALGRALDQAGGFEIGETAVKGPLGLHGTLAQQFTTRVDFAVGLFGVNGTGEGGENSAGARRDPVESTGAVHGAQDHPGQIGVVRLKWDVFFEGVQRPHASNAVSRDNHSSVIHMEMDFLLLDCRLRCATLRSVCRMFPICRRGVVAQGRAASPVFSKAFGLPPRAFVFGFYPLRSMGSR